MIRMKCWMMNEFIINLRPLYIWSECKRRHNNEKTLVRMREYFPQFNVRWWMTLSLFPSFPRTTCLVKVSMFCELRIYEIDTCIPVIVYVVQTKKVGDVINGDKWFPVICTAFGCFFSIAILSRTYDWSGINISQLWNGNSSILQQLRAVRKSGLPPSCWAAMVNA